MLRFSANLSVLFTEVPLISRFGLARQHGFDAVEIQFPYELSIDAIKTQLDVHQLQLILINVPAGDLMQGGNGLTGIPGGEYKFRQAVFDAIHYAKALAVPTVNILAGRQPEDADLLPCLHTLAANLRYAAAELSFAGITPVFEAINGLDMPRFLIQNIAQMQEMLEAVQHPALKMQYDCYHMAMMDEPVIDGLIQNIQHIGHIQFADCPHRHEPDTGRLNLREIFTWLKHSPYEGWCGAEYRPSQLTANSLAWRHWPEAQS